MVVGDELAVDFATNGLWHYDTSTWTHLAAWNPDGMAEWNGGLAVNFGAVNGLWNYDGTTWIHLAAWEAEYGIAWNNDLAIDFGTNGLWSYDGTTWTNLAAWNPDDGMVEWTGGLAVDFGASYGLWNYNGTTWNQLAGWNPEYGIAWNSGLAIDFGSNGLWYYDGSSWASLAGWNPDGMVAKLDEAFAKLTDVPVSLPRRVRHPQLRRDLLDHLVGGKGWMVDGNRLEFPGELQF